MHEETGYHPGFTRKLTIQMFPFDNGSPFNNRYKNQYCNIDYDYTSQNGWVGVTGQNRSFLKLYPSLQKLSKNLYKKDILN